MRPLRSLGVGLPNKRELIVQARDRVWAAIARPPDLVANGNAGGGRRLALSFDDGPSEANTAAILDLLDDHDARGTFFVVGSRIAGHEQLLARAVAGGHELANHTQSHIHTVHLSRGDLRQEITAASRAIKDACDGKSHEIRLVRPPFGKDRRRVVLVGRELGLLTVLWSVDSGDALGYSAKEIVTAVTAHTKPGSIVLMHDGGLRRDTTLSALKTVLPRLRDSGFELVTVSELLRPPIR
jgi:peptidoglycan-N-acetylglucosamine deacetylase